MTDKTRLRIGAGVTVVFLAGLSAAGLAARDGQPAGAATSARTTASVPAPDGPATGKPESDGAEDAERGALDAALSALAGVAGLDGDDVSERGDGAEDTERGALDAALSALAGVAGLDGDDGAEHGDDDDHEELEDDE
jgi:hypothetical protein